MERYRHSTFKRVLIDDLKEGKKYFIDFYVRNRYENRIGIFIKFIKDDFACFKISYYGWVMNYYIDDMSYFYEFNSNKEQIQNAMEQRAINIILRKVIGDESFIY
jgi:hypothetical protein